MKVVEIFKKVLLISLPEFEQEYCNIHHQRKNDLNLEMIVGAAEKVT